MSVHVLVHASQIYTGAGFRMRDGRQVRDEDLSIIVDGAIVYETGKGLSSGKIIWVGETNALPKRYSKAKKKNLKKQFAVTAGWVDSHTHLVFAGNRADEFAQRCGGKSYAEIAAAGGGISKTVRSTREASIAELEKLALDRLKEAYRLGARTVEIKSGYGLSHESELKLLEVIRRLQRKVKHMTLVPTYMGAHAFSPEMSREAYLKEMIEKTIPCIAQKKLAGICDVFVDDGYFSIAEAKALFLAAQAHGLRVKIHADELANTDAAVLGAHHSALSADHLLKISEVGIQALARSQTVATLLPATAFYLKSAQAPARRLIDAGACVALATDFNPGTSMTLSLPLVLTIAALYLGMTRAELLSAITYNAAKALGIEKNKGTLEPGCDADFTVLPYSSFEECYYRLG